MVISPMAIHCVSNCSLSSPLRISLLSRTVTPTSVDEGGSWSRKTHPRSCHQNLPRKNSCKSNRVRACPWYPATTAPMMMKKEVVLTLLGPRAPQLPPLVRATPATRSLSASGTFEKCVVAEKSACLSMTQSSENSLPPKRRRTRKRWPTKTPLTTPSSCCRRPRTTVC